MKFNALAGGKIADDGEVGTGEVVDAHVGECHIGSDNAAVDGQNVSLAPGAATPAVAL